MRSKLLFLIALLFAVNSAQAKYVYEYMEKVEPLLIEKKYSEASKEFDSLNERVKGQAINGYTLRMVYEQTVTWLKHIEEFGGSLRNIEANKSQFKASGDYGISSKSCDRDCKYIYSNDVDKGLPKSLPFSKKFITHVNDLRNISFNNFLKINGELREIEQEQKDRVKEARKAERKRNEKERQKKIESDRIIREENARKDKQDIENEIARIDKLAKDSGYAGYAGINLIGMIYKTQKEGGLERYINKVVGCHALLKNPCEKWYPKLKVIQILDDGVLYLFSEYSGGEHVSFTIISNKEAGMIYQEGQSLSNTYHVFKGMFSYETIAGVKKSIPAFASVKLGE